MLVSIEFHSDAGGCHARARLPGLRFPNIERERERERERDYRYVFIVRRVRLCVHQRACIHGQIKLSESESVLLGVWVEGVG